VKFLHWLKGLFKAFINFHKFLLAVLSPKEASEELAFARLKICNVCDKLDPITRQCLGGRDPCYCFVGLKVRFSEQTCPLGKW
jgi:hypothetical protein